MKKVRKQEGERERVCQSAGV